MNPAHVFSIANMLVIPMWFLLIFLPNIKITRLGINTKIIPILLSVTYAFYIIYSIVMGAELNFGNLESVMALFTEKNAVLAGWIHYLAFDILIGMWLVEQNRSIKIHPAFMGVCLFFTFMLGPVGFLLFMVFKSLKKRK